MSVSLISRQLHSLKLAQRAMAPRLASAMRVPLPPVVVSASHITTATATSTLHVASVDDNKRSKNLQLPFVTNITLMRKFSTNMEHTPSSSNDDGFLPDSSSYDDDDDDGGPIVPGAPASFKNMSNKELADMSTIPGWNLVHNPPRRNPRGALVGKVVSDKMQKTVNVAVDRFKMIPKYRKRWRFTRKFMAHDEHEVCNVGDLVMIVPCQKISRHKHFMVREIIRPKGQL